MGIAVKPLCSTEILFLSLTEMKQRLLSLSVENVLLIMGKEAADWWSLHSFLKEMLLIRQRRLPKPSAGNPTRIGRNL